MATPNIYRPGSKYYVDTTKVTQAEYVASLLTGIGHQRAGNKKLLKSFYNDQQRRQRSTSVN